MADIGNVLVGVCSVTLNPGGAVGFTADGVTMTIRSDFANIKVEEVVGTIIRKLTDQSVEITLNMAEGSLENLAAAIPGSELNGALTIGGGPLQEIEITLVGDAPGEVNERTIVLLACNPTGEVGIPYKKGAISVVPVTFSALAVDGVFGTITDAP